MQSLRRTYPDRFVALSETARLKPDHVSGRAKDMSYVKSCEQQWRVAHKDIATRLTQVGTDK